MFKLHNSVQQRSHVLTTIVFQANIRLTSLCTDYKYRNPISETVHRVALCGYGCSREDALWAAVVRLFLPVMGGL